MVADTSSWQARFCRMCIYVGVAEIVGSSMEHIFMVCMLLPGVRSSSDRCQKIMMLGYQLFHRR